MKNQTARILIITTMMGFLLFLSGCPADTTQNNQANKNATPVNAEKTPGEDLESEKCTNVSDQDIQDVIDKKLIESLKKQFKDGNIEFEFTGSTPADYKLIFKGSIKGGSENLIDLFTKFNKFRGKSCVTFVSFVGKDAVGDFEWNPGSNSKAIEDKADCKTNIDSKITKSLVKGQLDKNLSFYYDMQSRVLTFYGYVGDPESKDYFSKLLKELKTYMNNGCISKIVFSKAKSKEKDSEVRSLGFEWGLCEYPLCDSAGGCAPCNRKDSSEETKNKTESGSVADIEKTNSK